MTFITILIIAPERNKEVYDQIRKLRPPKEIKLTHAFGAFGDIDAILVYEAPSEEIAMDFLLKICKIKGIIDTKTYVVAPIRPLERG